MPLLRGSAHQLAVVQTDLVEAESLVRTMASREAMENPANFAGKTPCVYYKLPYVPPCDTFGELRRLILSVRENTGLRANFKGIVAIDATEWLGHERDEYFTVILKYLYDHRDIWQPAMVLRNCTETQLQRFLSACTRFITPRVVDAVLFSNRSRLADTVHLAFEQRGCRIRKDAAELLVSALARAELKDSRSLSLIDRVAEEILASAADRKVITEALVTEYLRSASATLTMLAGKILTEQRSQTYEK